MPNDYGDPYPSDLDDVAPGNPTAGFEEVDYDVNGVRGKKQKVAAPRDFFPGAQIPEKEEFEPGTWFGIVIEPLTTQDVIPRLYSVLRQDGKLVTAAILDLSPWEQYEAGDPVIVQRIHKKDQVPVLPEDTFQMVGAPQSKERQFVDLYLTSTITVDSSEEKVIPFSGINEQMPIDDLFVEDQNWQKIVLGDFISVTQEDEAAYEIQLHVTVELYKPVEEYNRIYFQTSCFNRPSLTAIPVSTPIRAPLLHFNHQNGFRTVLDPATCTAGVELHSDVRDTVLNQQDTNKSAFWTNCLKLGAHLHLGTQVSQGWIKWGNTWLSHGGGKLKLKLPRRSENNRWSYMVVESAYGDCVQLGWTPPGGTGEMELLTSEIDYYHYCYTDGSSTVPGSGGGGGILDDPGEPVTTLESFVPPGGSGNYCAIPVYKKCKVTVFRGLVYPNDCGVRPLTLTSSAECYDPPCSDDKPCGDV